MLYLAHEILTKGRIKGVQFLEAFYPHLLTSLPSFVVPTQDDKIAQECRKLASIWVECRLFGSSGSQAIRDILDGNKTTTTSGPLDPEPGPTHVPRLNDTTTNANATVPGAPETTTSTSTSSSRSDLQSMTLAVEAVETALVTYAEAERRGDSEGSLTAMLEEDRHRGWVLGELSAWRARESARREILQARIARAQKALKRAHRAPGGGGGGAGRSHGPNGRGCRRVGRVEKKQGPNGRGCRRVGRVEKQQGPNGRGCRRVGRVERKQGEGRWKRS